MRGYKLNSGLFIPERLAKKIGIGCPKCDTHFLQDPNLGKASPEAQKFIAQHARCGPLDALEVQNGKLVCTGPVEIRRLS